MIPAEDITAEESEALERALLIGTARQKLPAIGLLPTATGPMQALAGLAILAQRRRFVRPGRIPATATPRSFPDDPRPILPAPVRKALARLVDSSSKIPGTAVLIDNALQRVATHGWRLHPFDLPRLTAILRTLDHVLGPVERTYLAMLQPTGTPLPHGIDADNWTLFPRAARGTFLKHLRQMEPDLAREMLQACWAGEPAAMRWELVAALRSGLSDVDRTFLEQAAADRAETVRRAANAMLADLPGTPAHDEQIAEAASRFTLRDGKITAALEPHTQFDGFLRELGSLTLELLAERLGLAVPGLVALARIDEPVAFLAIMALAARARRSDIVTGLLERAGATPWEFYATTVFPPLAELPLSDRLALLPKLGSLARDPLPEAAAWISLGGFVGGILPEAEAAAVLASPAWQSFKTECFDEKFARRHDDDVAALAALMPAPLAPRLVAEIAELPVRTTLPIQAFASFVTALDAATPFAL